MRLQIGTTVRKVLRRLAVPSFAVGLVALSIGATVRPALAGTGDNFGGTVHYTAAPGEVNDVVAFQSGGNIWIWDQGTLNGAPITVTLGGGGGCSLTSISNPNDTMVCPAPPGTSLSLDLGDRNDFATIDPSLNGHLTSAIVDGGTGDDGLTNFSTVPSTASYADATNSVTVDLSTTSPQVTGQGTDSLSGFRNLLGSTFDDTLSGDANANSLNGNTGNDLLAGRGGNDVLIGGGGVDTASFTAAGAGVSVDLGIGGSQNTGDGFDTLSGISNILGSNFGDTLTGNGNPNTLNGRGGDDTLDGDTNNDDLIGGLGNDTITGGGGSDTADYSDSFAAVNVTLGIGGSQNTGDGFDTLSGISNLTGSSHDDTLVGNGGDNTLSGGAGNDVLVGGAGSDVLDGGLGVNTADYSAAAGAATIDLGAGFASPDGDGGADTLTSILNVVGTTQRDVIAGDGNPNTIQSGGGSDTVAGAGGNDTLDGGTGNDEVTYSALFGTSYAGSPNPVTVNLAAGTASGEGSDSLAGFETATGSAFADTLIPSSGGSTLQGAGGADTLVASGGGSDVLDGGPGTDTVDYSGAHGGIDVNLSSIFASDGDGGTDIIVSNSIENVTGSPFNDTIQGDANNNQLAGGAGTDTVSFAGTFNGVTVDLPNGTATGEGSDTLSGFENVTGSEQGDVIIGTDGPNVLSGAGGGDAITGGLGSDTISGGAGDDVIQAKDHVADTVTCGDDNDSVTKDSADSVASDCELVNVSPPKAVTGPANSITATGATLTATVNAHGENTTVYFEYGLKKRTYGMTTSSVIVKGKRNVPIGIAITGLSPDTTYHFRVVAVNSIGTTYGHDSIFVTSH